MKLDNPNNNKTCERCQQHFVCNPADIVACGCATISLTVEEAGYVATKYSDCVCNTCLLLLKDEFLALK